jgi:hypothetical protein
MVWGFTYLFKSTMRGLFSGEGVASAYGRPRTEGISNLYQDLEEQMESANAYNPYDISSDTGHDDCYSMI